MKILLSKEVKLSETKGYIKFCINGHYYWITPDEIDRYFDEPTNHEQIKSAFL